MTNISLCFGIRIPVLGHADGLCSLFVDKDADIEKAKKIVVDSKVRIDKVVHSFPT
jgi:glutamate-5-semialdehyde dehydrogenase